MNDFNNLQNKTIFMRLNFPSRKCISCPKIVNNETCVKHILSEYLERICIDGKDNAHFIHFISGSFRNLPNNSKQFVTKFCSWKIL